ncbi:MAG: ABC transporter permease [Ilumatobacteraceae bacterium]
MAVNWRKAVMIALPVIVVVVVAYAFYYGNSEAKTGAVLSRTFRSSTPLILGALCGLVGERTGVVNIGIEGQLLMSAFTGFYTAAATGNIWMGVLAGVLSGALLGAFLALCAVAWQIDQIIAGTVINIFVAGMTSFLYTQGKQSPGGLTERAIPLLSDIPLLGDVLFTNTPIAYMAIILVFVLHVALFHTRWGLRSRSVGEHPSASDTVGIRVARQRYVNVALAGGLAGLGGAFLSLESVGTFERGMSAQRGFTALAIMIFGRWKPILAWAGALFFSFTTAMAAQLQFDQVIDVPPQFIAILPYVLVIVVLAAFASKVRPPAAAGKPYVKE